ncbi:MAG: hypothetical protein HY231_14920 [Acidobacteria bacterium]|nr:hypothetical protein [Acidobacteriota bacterium]
MSFDDRSAIGLALLLGLAMFWPHQAVAEQLSIRRYSVSDGLAHNSVHCIHQDRKGYLWFGTNEGLSRFDGYRFINYGTRQGLENTYINALAEDRQGHLWVASNGSGVYRLLDDPHEALTLAPEAPTSTLRPKFRGFPVSDALGANRVNAMLFDAAGNLWCATDAGLYRATFNNNESRFEAIVPRQELNNNMCAFADSRGRLWFGLYDELIEITDGQLIKYGFEDEVSRFEITSIVEDQQQRLLVGNSHGIFVFIEASDRASRGRWKRFPLALQSDQKISSMIYDSKGTLWIATLMGLIKYSDGKPTVYTTTQGLSHNDLASLYEDREGILWLGTSQAGICKLSGEFIISFTAREGLVDLDIRKITENHNGEIFALSSDHGVVQIIGGQAVPLQRSLSPPFKVLRGRMLQSRSGDCWIGTDQGLFRFKASALLLRRGAKIPLHDAAFEKHISGIYEALDGKIWVGSWKQGLIYFDPARQQDNAFERVRLDANSRLPGAEGMACDGAGALWLGTHLGLGRLVNGKATIFDATDGLPEINPRCLFIDHRGWLWIGLRYKGVSMTTDPTAENPKFVNYSMANGLASDTVWTISEDDSGRLYFGTGRGLDRFDPLTGSIHHYGSLDGLAGDEIHHCFKDSRGNIWIGTTTGLSKLTPSAERQANGAPPIYISRVQIAGEDIGLAETGSANVPPLELSAARNNLRFEFVGLDSYSERALKYPYKLEG